MLQFYLEGQLLCYDSLGAVIAWLLDAGEWMGRKDEVERTLR